MPQSQLKKMVEDLGIDGSESHISQKQLEEWNLITLKDKLWLSPNVK